MTIWTTSLEDGGEISRAVDTHLLDEVVPFWTEHGLDGANGERGVATCMKEDGRLLAPDRYGWSQWRAVWVFSRLADQYPSLSGCLDTALNVARFAASRGWDVESEGWAWKMDARGRILEGYRSIYADAFAIYGLAELARVSGQSKWIELARMTADCVIERLAGPHDRIPHLPYPIPRGARVHGIPMIFSYHLWELGKVSGDQRFLDVSANLSDEIFDRFYDSGEDLLFERVSGRGGRFAGPDGTAVVPGHVIEDMWFQMLIARETGNRARVRTCRHLIRRHLEWGWDSEFGGLFLARNSDPRHPGAGWHLPESKLWWPHTEALVALALCWADEPEDWISTWWDAIRDYSARVFYMPEAGEWRQRCDRSGKPMNELVALPVKDCFHLPRALALISSFLAPADRSIFAGEPEKLAWSK